MQPDNISDHYLLIPSQQISCRVSCNGLLENRIPFQLPLRTDSKLYPCTKRQEALVLYHCHWLQTSMDGSFCIIHMYTFMAYFVLEPN
jgi:hypothetical protein